MKPKGRETGLRIWMQPSATCVEIVCAWYALLLKEEREWALHNVDLFTGEVTEILERLTYEQSQPKSTIGPRRTSKILVTDVRESRVGKVGLAAAQAKQRRAKRLAAKHDCTASTMEATVDDLVESMYAIHSATVKDAIQNKGVPKAYRMGGWCAFQMTQDGWDVATGPEWKGCPMENNRVDKTTWARRYENLDEKGKPKPPPFERVVKLKQKQDQLREANRLANQLKTKILKMKVKECQDELLARTEALQKLAEGGCKPLQGDPEFMEQLKNAQDEPINQFSSFLNRLIVPPFSLLSKHFAVRGSECDFPCNDASVFR